MSKFLLRIKQFRIMFFLALFKIVAFFIKPSHWVICERGTEARDNGYSFYKYMKEKHPEQKIFYLITKDSSDFYKVKDDAVIFNSIKSFWVIASAQKIISAHYAAVLPLPLATKIFYLFRLYNKFYFLQHGVIKDDLKSLYADIAPMKLFVCGAKPEYDDIVSKYGHPAGVVRYTGLARFDYLHDIKPKKQILVMPTWRTYIRNKDDFINSSYYSYWQELLCDRDLSKELCKHNIELVFYVHYEMQKYTGVFKTASKNIIIAKKENCDIQDLLKESALLITDYSSVFFDFAYMKKPIIYYHFDKYHYAKGYFDYKTMGFGKVCTQHKKLIEEITISIKNDFIMEEPYIKRTEDFFPLYDTNNCNRIYKAILENA